MEISDIFSRFLNMQTRSFYPPVKMSQLEVGPFGASKLFFLSCISTTCILYQLVPFFLSLAIYLPNVHLLPILSSLVATSVSILMQ